MKPLLRILCTLCISVGFMPSFGQTCTTASLNWDALSFLNSTTYGTLNTATNTNSYQNQSFAFGKNKVTVTHNYSSTNALGENGTHTGDAGSFGTGDDVQFRGNGTITFTFQSAVKDVKFSIYDIDNSQVVSVTAQNGTIPQNVTMAAVTNAVLGIIGSNTVSAIATASSTRVPNTSNDGTINLTIAGPVTSFTIAVSSTGSGCNSKCGTTGTEDGSFWVSDIEACSSGSFPLNYQKTGANQPFTNQPDYFLSTPDNNSAYMVDPATGKASWLFTEAAGKYINSFAYDPYKHILYYVLDATTTPATNKKIKKYDFNTETISDFVPDVTAIGIPTFTGGVESAGASFYDGALYLGIEGGTTGETMTWRIDIDATTGNATGTAYQVYGIPASGHDWGDFILKDGVLYDFNTSTTTGQFKHLNLQTGSLISYNSTNVGQAAMSWTGDLYSVRNVVEKYNLDGTKGTPITITSVKGPTWVGNAGDASENFRPKADFGDAPASYDPDPLAPAMHELDANLRLGATEDVEWKQKGATAAADTDTDDGLTYVRILNLSGGKYQTDVTVYNNTGANATVVAWIDFNNDGVFQASEGITPVTVGTSTALQTVSLSWTGISSNLPNNSNTYLRIRVTSATNNMTAANPTGYYSNGEVEDYYVPVNVTPLAVQKLQFDAVKEKNQVKVKWTVSDESDVVSFVGMRSADAINWQPINEVMAKGIYAYTTVDNRPLEGNSYYRLKTLYRDGRVSFSEAKEVAFELSKLVVNINTNPAVDNLNLSVYAPQSGPASLTLVSMNGLGLINLSSTLQKGYNSIKIPVTQLQAGNYILQINQGAFSERKKVMVLK